MQRLHFYCLFNIFCMIQNVMSYCADPLVNTGVGSIRGLRATDGNYSRFMGIPYGTVDTDNPFGKSKPYPNFKEVFEAYDDTTKCPQVYNDTIVGVLDCLRLNVYVPFTASSDNPMAVMVFIHGGGFDHNFAGLYGPKYFMPHDVILVTLNYRLGPYGFMCLDIPKVSGNQGLADQLIALRWVKNNIKAFGGDDKRITLFGQSAGGQSIDLLMTFSNEILYNNIILESGTDLARTLLYAPDKNAPIKLAQYLGYETNHVTEALSFLEKCNTTYVIKAVADLGILFKPCVERKFKDLDSLITHYWIDAKVPKVKYIPVLMGFNRDERAIAHTNTSDYTENLNLVSQFMNQTFDFNNDKFEEMKANISNFYFGGGESNINMTMSAIKFDSDFTYISPVWRSLNKYLQNGRNAIFFYVFSYNSDSNILPSYVSHTDELGYIFNMSSEKPKDTCQDKLIIERMTTMWSNFAKYSNPTPEGTDILPVQWLPTTPETYHYLKIDKELILGSRPLQKSMDFWDDFYNRNEKYQRFIRKSNN